MGTVRNFNVPCSFSMLKWKGDPLVKHLEHEIVTVGKINFKALRKDEQNCLYSALFLRIQELYQTNNNVKEENTQ